AAPARAPRVRSDAQRTLQHFDLVQSAAPWRPSREIDPRYVRDRENAQLPPHLIVNFFAGQ
ncbi:hypothetical protein, partial [Klebsiella pneumoniae]|uniref:hypothetical protein n=1 Tax=Klebsiella pneumoniae TaxID=573 RepID=UPI003D6B8191